MLAKLKPQNCCVIVLGSAILAFGIYQVHSISSITEGGGLGLILLVQYWLHISPAISSLVFDLVGYAVGWKVLGSGFLVYSMLSTVTFSAVYAVAERFPHLWPQLAHMPLTAALVGALFVGVGAGLCVRAGAAAGSDDAVAMSLAKITGIEIQWIYLVSDLSVLLLSVSYLPWSRLAYSLVTVTLSGQIIGVIQKLPSIKSS